MKTLLIDGDQVVFKCCSAIERETRWDEQNHVLSVNEEEAWDSIKSMIRRLYERFDTEHHVVCFSSPPNFRFDIEPSYKNNRASMRKPMCYADIRERVEKNYKCYSIPRLEADDVMGILATKPSDRQCIIVSQDKDMKTVPAEVWNGKELVTYSEAEADYWHLYQTLVGDTSDGYKGCPGIGAVKATKLLDIVWSEAKELWSVIVAAFVKAGLTEDDALTQARLARILRWSDWDSKKKEPKLWLP